METDVERDLEEDCDIAGEVAVPVSKFSRNISFAVGDSFHTFEELDEKIRMYEQCNSVQLWKRDTRTIQAVQKRMSRPLNERIKYYEIVYSCIHGGKRFKSKGIGKRTSSTFRKGCPAMVSLRASEDGQSLVVKKVNEEHSHVVSKQLFKRLPRQRKLTSPEKKEAEKFLSLQANKKMLQDRLTQATGKAVTLKDLTNISTSMHSKSTHNDLQTCVQKLTEKYGACVEVLTSESKVLQGIYFQDQEMKDVFAAYPELVCIDATYKLLELRFPVYIILVEDGNGQSEIAAVFLMLEETEESMSQMMSFFKKENPNWELVRVLMGDKDLTQRDVLVKAFPSASLLICLFHTFRSFRHEVTTEKMGITSGQRNLCLEILQQLAYCTSEQKYQEIYSRFCDSAPSTVLEYFNSNWHPIRQQWAMGMKYSSGNFLNSTNNRLESLNAKLKSVIARYSSLEEFVDKFFLVCRVLRSERDHKAALVAQKVPVAYYSANNAACIKYIQHLTPYANHFVTKQMDLKEKVKLKPSQDQDHYEVDSGEGMLMVTSTSCECTSWNSMKLPCRHIFALRTALELDLFEEELCDKRWSMTYYKEKQRIFQIECSDDNPSPCVNISQVPVQKKRPMSQAEKFRYVSKLTTSLASLASESTGSVFTSRCDLLKKILSAWECDEECDIQNDGDFPKDQELNVANELDNHEKSDLYTEGGHDAQAIDGTSNDDGTGDLSDLSSQFMAQQLKLSVTTEPEIVEYNKSDHQKKITARELRNGLSTPSPQFIALNPNVPDLSIPHLEARIQKENTVPLEEITIPPVVRKRGRPKGHESTVIGLPSKKKKTTRLRPFLKLHTSLKEKLMLSWFVDQPVSIAVLKDCKELIEEKSVEVHPENLPDAILDENVDVHLIRKYFTSDAWVLVKDVIARKTTNHVYTCKICHHDLHQFPSIVCDHCLTWFHMKCMGLKQSPKGRHWFCRECLSQA